MLFSWDILCHQCRLQNGQEDECDKERQIQRQGGKYLKTLQNTANGINDNLGYLINEVGDAVFVFTPQTVQLTDESKKSDFGTEPLWTGKL